MGCLRRGIHESTVRATRQRVQLPASERAESKPAMPFTRRNDKAGQLGSSAVVHHATSRR